MAHIAGKKPNLGLGRSGKGKKKTNLAAWRGFGKGQKAKFGGLEGLEEAKKSHICGLGGFGKRPKSQIWKAWKGVWKRPKSRGLEGIWKKIGGLGKG